MACTARFAEAWEFASFWCIGSTVRGTDNSGLAAQALLTDSQANFVNAGIKANVGVVLYNITDGSSGPVTAVTTNTLTATLTGGTGNNWDNGDSYRIVAIDQFEISTIETYLDIAAADVHAAMAAADACDCTLAAWATTFLKKLNIIDAEALYQCQCAKVKLSDEMRTNYLNWADAQFAMIRKGEIELCDGETGSDFPAIAFASQSVTEFAAARIIADDIDRNS